MPRKKCGDKLISRTAAGAPKSGNRNDERAGAADREERNEAPRQIGMPRGCGAAVHKMCLVKTSSDRPPALEDVIDLEEDGDGPATCPELGYNPYCNLYCMDCAAEAGLLDEKAEKAWLEEKKARIWEEDSKKYYKGWIVRPSTPQDAQEASKLLADSYRRLLSKDYSEEILAKALPIICTPQPSLLTCGTWYVV